jgi:hypothetical protein
MFRFWCNLCEAYPILTKQAFQVLIPFVTKYPCKSRFVVLFSFCLNQSEEQTKSWTWHASGSLNNIIWTWSVGCYIAAAILMCFGIWYSFFHNFFCAWTK